MIIPPVQTRIAKIATEELSKKLGVPVKINRVNIKWFNRFIIEDLYLEDQNGKVLFSANHVAAGFEILPLFEGKLTFNAVRLFGPKVKLNRKSMADPLNLKFVIDAFAPKDSVPKKKLDINFRFKTILITDGHFSYDVEDADSTPGKFNAKHVDIKDLKAKISIKTLQKDSIYAQIKKLSLFEKSGFSLNKLSLTFAGSMDSLFVKDLNVKLAHTDLKIPSAKINLLDKDSSHVSFLDRAVMSLQINPSIVCLQDIAPFVPVLSNFSDTIEIFAHADGRVNDMKLHNLTLNYSDKMRLIGKMALKEITEPQKAFVQGEVEDMFVTPEALNYIINSFSKKPFAMPAPLVKLGTINFSGKLSGHFDRLKAAGFLSTNVGTVQTDILFGKDKKRNIDAFLKGHVGTSEIELGQLLGEKTKLGKAQCQIDIDAVRPVNGVLSGNVNANIARLDFKDYSYQDIKLIGKFKGKSFDGHFQIDDEYVALTADGLFDDKKENSVVNLSVKVDRFMPDKLNLFNKYEDPNLSFALNASLRGNNVDNLVGNLDINDISIYTKPSSFYLDNLRLSSTSENDYRNLKIKSNLINGEIKGAFTFASLVSNVMNTLDIYLPTVVGSTRHSEKMQKQPVLPSSDISLFFTIQNTDSLSNTLKLPISFIHPARIIGAYNSLYNKIRLEAYLPKFRVGKTFMDGGYVQCYNPGDKMDLTVRTTQYNTKGMRNYLDLHLDAAHDCIGTLIEWHNNKEREFSAKISANACFFKEIDFDEKEESVLRTEISLNQTPIVINDTLWNLLPSDITLRKGKIGVRDFKIERDDQFIHLDGVVSKEVTDSLFLNLNKVELGYLFDILNIDVVKFSGEATGKFNISDVYGKKMLNTNLHVSDFAFNKVALGKLDLYSEWDNEKMGISMDGLIYKNDTVNTKVDGYIYPVRTALRSDGLSLKFDARDLDVGFIYPFVQKIFDRVQGRGFGKVHLFGPFKQLTVVGDAFVKDGGLGVGFLNTNYTFSDSIHMDTTRIQVNNLKISDKYNNTGTVDLTFNHRYFKDFDYHVNINTDKMLMYDVSEKQNSLIYGTIFAGGTANVEGNTENSDFAINMRSMPKTHVYLNFMGNSSASEYDFITFIDKEKLKQEAMQHEEAVRDSISRQLFRTEGADLNMNFSLDVTPDAEIELIIDPNAGDRIKGYGEGNLTVNYGNRQDVRIFGKLGILSGIYNFSLQQLIHKDFKIREGSTIDFNGDPFNANMDINAIYNLTANLSDLDQNLALESARTNVPVNCVLNLNGMLRQPQISFGLELPGSNEELERQMRSLIDTDDMMMRQIVYLLVLNKFYTPEYTGTPRSNDFTAVASSALSSQLSSLLNNITDKVQIGTNIRASQDGITDTEVEMLLSSQLLNNRLLFNGNFGYKNNPTQKNAFIGEFDLEYKLTRSGEIRLKAYNHANDMYQYLKQALTTQGVGVMFKKDFTRFSDLFQRRKVRLPRIPLNNPESVTAPTDSIKKHKHKK